MPHTISLALDGLSCSHCVKRVKEALEQRDDVEQAEVTQQEARVSGRADAAALIATVEQADYHATLKATNLSPKTEPLTASEPPPEALTTESLSRPAEKIVPAHMLLIEGMTCASCVSRIEKALQQAAGVSQARVNLGERSALVLGEVEPQKLVAAVDAAGYDAASGDRRSGAGRRGHCQR